MIGLVYLIRANETDHYKIGFTTKTPEERRAALQTGNPRKLEVVASWSGTSDDERKLHALLGPYRKEGEWFELTIPRLITLLCQYEAQVQFEERILSDKDLEARIVSDIQNYYYEYGPYATDQGIVQVSEGFRELLRLRILDCHLWKWYALEELQGLLPFDRHEAQNGSLLFDLCVEEGWVEEGPSGTYRVDPNLNQAGYEFFLELVGI